MIPADAWPEGAVMLVWGKYGQAARLDAFGGGWALTACNTPMPDGHDWRVPVMRPTVKESLTVDLGQFRDLIGFACWQALNLPETDPRRDFIRQCGELLALIDSQGTASAVLRGPNTHYHDKDGIHGTVKRLRTYARVHRPTLLGQTMEEAAAYIEHVLAAAQEGSDATSA